MPFARPVGKSTHFTIVFCTTGGDSPRLTDVRFFFGHIGGDAARCRLSDDGEEIGEIAVRHFDAHEQGPLSAVVEYALQQILRDSDRRRRAEGAISGVLRRIIRQLPGPWLECQADAA